MGASKNGFQPSKSSTEPVFSSQKPPQTPLIPPPFDKAKSTGLVKKNEKARVSDTMAVVNNRKILKIPASLSGALTEEGKASDYKTSSSYRVETVSVKQLRALWS